MRKCLLTIYIFLLFIFFISSHVVLSEDKQEINIESDYVIKKLGYKLGVTNFSYPLHLVVDNFFLGRCLVSCCHLDEPPKKHPPIL